MHMLSTVFKISCNFTSNHEQPDTIKLICTETVE